MAQPISSRVPSDPPGVDVFVAAGWQRIRVRQRAGFGVPLVLCNGIGVSLEVLDPLVDALDPDRPVIRFDVPGTGDSPAWPCPTGSRIWPGCWAEC